MAPDPALPDRKVQVPDEEAHVGVATGGHSRLSHQQLHLRLE